MSIAILDYPGHLYVHVSTEERPQIVKEIVRERYVPHSLYRVRVYAYSADRERHIRNILRSTSEPNLFRADACVKQRIHKYLSGDLTTLRVTIDTLFNSCISVSPNKLLPCKLAFQHVQDTAVARGVAYKVRRQLSYHRFLDWCRKTPGVEYLAVADSNAAQEQLGTRRVRSVLSGYAVRREDSRLLKINASAGNTERHTSRPESVHLREAPHIHSPGVQTENPTVPRYTDTAGALPEEVLQAPATPRGLSH